MLAKKKRFEAVDDVGRCDVGFLSTWRRQSVQLCQTIQTSGRNHWDGIGHVFGKFFEDLAREIWAKSFLKIKINDLEHGIQEVLNKYLPMRKKIEQFELVQLDYDRYKQGLEKAMKEGRQDEAVCKTNPKKNISFFPVWFFILFEIWFGLNFIFRLNFWPVFLFKFWFRLNLICLNFVFLFEFWFSFDLVWFLILFEFWVELFSNA